MAFKFVVFAAVLALASAGNPQYEFGYGVQDPLTGDSKNQFETRTGDFVQGQYSLNDPDGTRRIVDYVADPINGFNANVRKEPLIAKAAVAAPVLPAIRSGSYYPASPLIRSAPVLSQPAIAAPVLSQPAPLLRSYAAPAISAAPLLRSYGGPAIGESPALLGGAYASPAIPAIPFLRSYGGSVLNAAPLLRSGSIYSTGYTGSLGYSAGSAYGYGGYTNQALGYAAGPGYGYGGYVNPALGYAARSTLGYGKITTPGFGYSNLIH